MGQDVGMKFKYLPVNKSFIFYQIWKMLRNFHLDLPPESRLSIGYEHVLGVIQ